MYKKIKHFFAALTACAVTAAAMTVFPVNAVGETGSSEVTNSAAVSLTYYDEEFKAPYSCNDLLAWKADDDDGEATIVRNSVGGYYVCNWDGTRLAEFLVGEEKVQSIDDVKDCFVKYEAAFKGTESYAIGAVVECYDAGNKKAAEMRVLDSYAEDAFSADINNAKKISINGTDYYAIIAEEENVPVEIIYIVRCESLDGGSISGKIDFKAIDAELKNNGFKIEIRKQPKLYVRGTGEKGKIFVNDVTLANVPHKGSIKVENHYDSRNPVWLNGQYYSYSSLDKGLRNGMTVSDDGTAHCVYENCNTNSDSAFFRGILDEKAVSFDEYEKMNVHYEATIKAKDKYAVGVELFDRDSITSINIVQFSNTKEFVDDGHDRADVKHLDCVEVDGIKYDIYSRTFNYESCMGLPAPQIWCISQVSFEQEAYGAVGDIDLKKHYDVWLKNYLEKTNKISEILMFAESFGAGRGEFDLENAEFDLVKKDDVYDRVIDNTSINAPAEPIIEGGSMVFCTENGKCTLKKNGTIIGNCFQNYDDSVFKFGKSLNFEMADEQIDRDKGDFINMDFKANISTDGNYSLGAEGRMCDEHGEEYIDFYMYPVLNYDAVPKEAKYLGSKEFTDREYDIYVYYNDHVVTAGGKKNVKYYCIAKNKTPNDTIVSGTIYLADAVIAWKNAGLEVGPITNVALNANICGIGSGEIELLHNDIIVERMNREKFTSDDILLFQKYLLGEECDLEDKNFDLNYDGVFDNFDMIELRRQVLNNY